MQVRWKRLKNILYTVTISVFKGEPNDIAVFHGHSYVCLLIKELIIEQISVNFP